MKFIVTTKIIAAIACCALATPAFAHGIQANGPAPDATPSQPARSIHPVQVEGAWARATVAGQKSTGAFMRITARSATTLVGISSTAAGITELHEMKMNGDVMTMRELPALDLPAGKAVELKSGGRHIMLMDLNRALSPGATIALVLKFRDAGGVESTLALTVPVSKVAPAAEPGAASIKP